MTRLPRGGGHRSPAVNALRPALLAAVLLSVPLDVRAAEEPPPVRNFAVVVGTTRPHRADVATLRYADDDAARWHELLSLFADRVELLAVLDEETQRRHPGLAAHTRVPTREELENALARTREAVAAAKARGERTAFWFVFAGHGDVDDRREGFLVLQDGRFTRTDLFGSVVRPSNADVNHLVLDACRAVFLVGRRGPGAAAAIRELLDASSLDAYPNTGVLVATTESAEVHEWSRWSAGVFSHEVRSALLGGADVDGDARVTYLEVGAFVAAANAQVRDPRGHLAVSALPPRTDRDTALVDWRAAAGTASLSIDGSATGAAVHVEDERGVRIADVHAASGEPRTLFLAPDRTFFIRGAGWEARFAPGAGDEVLLSSLAREAPGLAGRGSVGDALARGLFAVPFGRGFYDGWRARHPVGLAPPSAAPRTRARWRPVAAWSGVGASAGLAGGAWWELRQAAAAAREHRNAFGTAAEVDALRRRARRHEQQAQLLAGTSVGTALLSAWLFRSGSSRVSLAVDAAPDAAAFRLTIVEAP